MKYLFFTIFLSLTFSLNGQEKVYKRTYESEDLSISLFSDDRFRLYTPWEDGTGSINRIWGKGVVSYRKDTIICADAITHKKIYLVKKENNDIVRIINWEDYKDRSDENNAVWGYKDNYSLIFLDDFLLKNNLLYLRSIYEGTKQHENLKLLKVYSWESGSKKLVYESNQ